MNDLGKEQLMQGSPLAKLASEIIRVKEIPVLEKGGILIAYTKDSDSGLELASDILYGTVDKDTLLLLSGGLTPKPLYEQLAKEKKLRPGAVGLVDERIGPIELTNEKMIGDTGLVRYLEQANAWFYSIRRSQGQRVEQTALNYNNNLKNLFRMFTKKIAILGIGPDGHVASIAPNREDFINPVFGLSNNVIAAAVEDPKSMKDGGFGKRVTLTPRALREMDLLICLVFGGNKKLALERMFEDLPITMIPAHFLTSGDMARKVILITDQKL